MNNRIKNTDDSPLEHELQEDSPIADDTVNTQDAQRPNSPPEAEPPKERAGVILKREREAKGISLDIVHESTKIPMDALRAIEEGYKVRMLSPFYYSGFIRLYCKFLELDVSEVIDDYKEEEIPQHADVDIEVEDEIQMPKWLTNFFTKQRKQQIVIGIGAIIALYLFVQLLGFIFSRETKPKAQNEIVKVEAANEAKVSAPKPKKPVQREAPKIEVPKEVPKVVAPTVIPIPVPKPKPAAVNQAAAKPKAKPPAAIQKDVNLTVRANQNSWLRVKTDGKVIFQSTLRMGAVETWFADKEIEISGRNISKLEFELNGKMIGTLGRKDRNAKKVIITKDGLSVKQ